MKSVISLLQPRNLLRHRGRARDRQIQREKHIDTQRQQERQFRELRVLISIRNPECSQDISSDCKKKDSRHTLFTWQSPYPKTLLPHPNTQISFLFYFMNAVSIYHSVLIPLEDYSLTK